MASFILVVALGVPSPQSCLMAITCRKETMHYSVARNFYLFRVDVWVGGVDEGIIVYAPHFLCCQQAHIQYVRTQSYI